MKCVKLAERAYSFRFFFQSLKNIVFFHHLSCIDGFWECKVCFKYLSSTSNFVESFMRF